VCALENNLLAGTASAHGTPQTWLDTYALSDEDADTDGDGAAAWQEYYAGTDPVDSRSLLTFTSAESGENQFVLQRAKRRLLFQGSGSITHLVITGFRL